MKKSKIKVIFISLTFLLSSNESKSSRLIPELFEQVPKVSRILHKNNNSTFLMDYKLRQLRKTEFTIFNAQDGHIRFPKNLHNLNDNSTFPIDYSLQKSRKMKLITLNIWGGHVRKELLKFTQRHQDVDIFCLQEVYNNAPHKISTDDNTVSLNIFSELNTLLPNHNGFFRPVVNNSYGIGILIKKNIDVIDEGEFKIHDNPNYVGRGPTHSRILQWLNYHVNNQIYTVVNVHGLWNGNGKTDTPERINQSQKIRQFIDDLNIPVILCGDFNLRPDTESIKILESQMINLIQKYNITSTRTSLYPKDEKYADYIFVSPKINITGFEVMSDVVSDHSPLLLNFAIPEK